MELKDYTFEQIEEEYLSRKKQIKEQRKAERAKIKRCHNCKHYGSIDMHGKPREPFEEIPPLSVYCPFAKNKTKSRFTGYNKVVQPYAKACEHYEKRKEELL